MSAWRDDEAADGGRRWLLISAGHGPAECAWAVARLAPIVAAAAAAAGLAWREVDRTPGSAPDTAASVLLEIEDMSEGTDRIDALVDAWRGTILWVSKSPLRPHHRRRNWYVKVTAIAAAAPAIAAAVREGECEITAIRSGGAGGQHVNKRSTAVRVLHRPSGIEVVAREERSQHQNRRLAFERIAAILAVRADAAAAAAQRARWGEHQAIERGNPRRTFRGPDFVADVDRSTPTTSRTEPR